LWLILLRSVPQSLRRASQSCETFRRVCGRLRRVAKRSAEFAEGFAELRNVPQSLRKASQSCETFRRVCGRLRRVAKRPAEFAEGFAELRNVRCGRCSSSAAVRVIGCSHPLQHSAELICDCLTELKFLLPKGCGLAKSAATEGISAWRNVPQGLRKEWGCVKSPGRGEYLLLTPYKQSAVRGAGVDDMSLRDF